MKILTILALLIALQSCGYDDSKEIPAQEPETAPVIDEISQGDPEYSDDQKSDSEDDLDRQPQWSPDKLYKGMPKEEVLDLLGTPASIFGSTGDYFHYWEYLPEVEFCTLDYLECRIYFDDAGLVSETYKIDPEYIHITSF